MGQPVRRTLVAAFAVLAIAVGGAALAWACSPVQGWISAQGPSGGSWGPVGSTVTVHGTNFMAGKPVEIYLNGTHVGSASGSPFTTSFTVPNVPERDYMIQAVGQASNGSGERTAVTTFWVGEPPAAQQPASGSPSTDGGEDTASGEDAAPSTRSAAGGTSGEIRSGSSSATTSGGDAGSAGSPNAAVSGGEGTRDAPGAGGDDGGVVTTGSGQAVFADSLGADGPKGAGPAAPRSENPSARSASGDLWSGFASGEGPSRADFAAASAGSDAPGSALSLSVALGGLGLLVLLSGVGATGVRRRRAIARGGPSTG